MPDSATQNGLERRDFLKLSSFAAAAALLRPNESAAAIQHESLDPVNPNIFFGSTSSLWGRRHDIIWGIKRMKALGLQGIEPYSGQIDPYRSNPLKLKKIFDEHGITLIDVSNGGGGQSTNFIDPAQTPKTIEDHVAFARDFLQPCGCGHYKANMGRRPDEGPTHDQLKRVVETCNEIGRRTIEYGVKFAPHPHAWGPIEREDEIRFLMEETDPNYVWMTADTGHMVLGGASAAELIDDYFPRVVEIHMKDTFGRYRRNRQTPTREQHQVASVYHNMGGGGVDWPAVFNVLRKRNFSGWAIFDLDGPRVGDDGFEVMGGDLSMDLAVDNYLATNVNYLRQVLGIKLPPFE